VPGSPQPGSIFRDGQEVIPSDVCGMRATLEGLWQCFA
jgi:hypothetical protein